MYPGQKQTTQRCFIYTQQERPGTIESGGEDALKQNSAEASGAETVPSHIFEERNAYIKITVTLSEAINPHVEPKMMPRAQDIAKNATKNIPTNFPNVEDAVIDFRNAVHGVLNNIVLEYSVMFQGEEDQSP